jgi:hypothetical protein
VQGMRTSVDRMPAGAVVAGAVLAATVAQLALGAVSDLPQFAGKGFGARLVAYPLMMLLLPAVLWGRRALRGGGSALPWTPVALVMAPFLIDVTGNSLDLYDSVTWWDDANHFTNWALLCAGLGLLTRRSVTSRTALVGLVTGIGATLAVLWEVGEWWSFIRHGTELTTAYEDTLGDEVLGTLGALVAGLVLACLSPPGRG